MKITEAYPTTEHDVLTGPTPDREPMIDTDDATTAAREAFAKASTETLQGLIDVYQARYPNDSHLPLLIEELNRRKAEATP